MKKWLLFLFAFILISQPIFALGISPASIYSNFEPNKKENFTITILNSVNAEEYIEVFIARSYEPGDKDMTDYVRVSDDFIILPPNGGGVLTFYVDFPEYIEPGKYLTYINMVEKAPSESGLVARLALGFKYVVYSPYPGKYIDIEFDAPKFIKQNEQDVFRIKAISRGETNITEIKSYIKITGPDNSSIATLTGVPFSLPAKAEETATIPWIADADPGIYYASALVTYDGGFKTDVKSFMVGDISVKILGVINEDIKKGSIGKFNLRLRSIWNSPIKNMYVKGEFYKDGLKIDEMKGENFDIDGWSEKNVTVYWDTKDFDAGDYEVKFILFYSDKTDEYKAPVRIVADNLFYFILAGVIILILILPIIYYYRKKSSKRR